MSCFKDIRQSRHENPRLRRHLEIETGSDNKSCIEGKGGRGDA
jgi:hypothetical protein